MRRLLLGLFSAGLTGAGAGCFDFTGTLCGGANGECVSGYTCDSTGRCRPEGDADPDGGVDGGQTDGGQTDGGETDGGDGGPGDAGQTDSGDGGETDDGGSTECTPAATESCGNQLGECLGATRVCQPDGAWGACDKSPLEEKCNGLDDDCDGTSDDLADPGPKVLATSVNEFNWVATDAGFAAAMLSRPGGIDQQMVFRLYDSSFTPLIDQRTVDPASLRAFQPTVSSFRGNTFVSWVQIEDGGTRRVQLARMSADGGDYEQVDVDGLADGGTGVNLGTAAPHSLDLAGTSVLVLWQDNSLLWGRVFSPELDALTTPAQLSLSLPTNAFVAEQAVAPAPTGGFRVVYSWVDVDGEESLIDVVAVGPTLASPTLQDRWLAWNPGFLGANRVGPVVQVTWESAGWGFMSADGGTALQFGPVVRGLDVTVLEGRPIAVFERPMGTVLGADLSGPQPADGGQLLVPLGAELPSVAPAGENRLAIAYRRDGGIQGVLRCAPSNE